MHVNFTALSLSRLELTNSEVEKELNRVRLEAANLRDVVLQLQTRNEELSQDKDELNLYHANSLIVGLSDHRGTSTIPA